MRPTMRPPTCERSVFTAGVGFLVAALSALATHAVVEAGESVDSAFSRRAHLSLGPVAMSALVLVAIFVVRALLASASRRGEGSPARLAARWIQATSPASFAAASSAASVLLFGAMESSEQLAATGRLAAGCDLLGQHPAATLALLVGAALALACALFGSASAIFGAIDALCSHAVAVFLRRVPRAAPGAASRRPVVRRVTASALRRVRGSGLRAPPPRYGTLLRF